MESGINFFIGDWLAFGERKWGELKETAERLGLKYDKVAQAKWVAGKVCTRVQTLSWAHHRYVAALDENGQRYWLEKAMAEEGLTQEVIAEALAVSVGCVNGWVSHITKRRERSRNARIWWLGLLGWTQKEIGEHVGDVPRPDGH